MHDLSYVQPLSLGSLDMDYITSLIFSIKFPPIAFNVTSLKLKLLVFSFHYDSVY